MPRSDPPTALILTLRECLHEALVLGLSAEAPLEAMLGWLEAAIAW